jgi:hypothetical protein
MAAAEQTFQKLVAQLGFLRAKRIDPGHEA